MSSLGGIKPCYPRSTFYPLKLSGPSMRNHPDPLCSYVSTLVDLSVLNSQSALVITLTAGYQA